MKNSKKHTKFIIHFHITKGAIKKIKMGFCIFLKKTILILMLIFTFLGSNFFVKNKINNFSKTFVTKLATQIF